MVDNGPEFTSKALAAWAKDSGVRLHFITPGKPTENGYIESFNGKFRDECLNLNWFQDLADSRVTIEDWRTDCNLARLHSSLGYLRSGRGFCNKSPLLVFWGLTGLVPWKSRLGTDPLQEVLGTAIWTK